jgi:diguanylate cyclase (GGDEF)-like protein
MSRAIGTTLGVADSMTVIAAKLQNLVPFGACALFLLETPKGIVRCQFATGIAADRLRRLTLPVGTGAVGRVASTRQCIVNGEPATDAAAAGLDAEAIPFKSLLACPLLVADGVVGVLALYHGEVAAFSEDHRRLVNLVSEQAAAVILNSVVFEQTQVDSVTDALTGLPNIRLLFVHLTRELSRATRLDAPVSLILLDLDNLKDINDTYGHSTGDHALCKVATALAAAIRPYDLCVRYGGDEFIVVLSGCGREEADAKLAELQQAIDAIVFEAAGRRRVRLAVSGGAAVFPQDGKAYEALLAVADRRMYHDKTQRKQGRSQTHNSHGAPGLSNVDLERAAQGVL